MLICAFTIDRIGRRRWVTASFVLGGIMLGALGLTGAESVVSVMVLGTLSYGVIGSTNAVLFSGVSVVGAVAAMGMIETRNRRLEDIAS